MDIPKNRCRMIESGGQSLPEEQQGLPDETRRGNRMRPQGQPPENGGNPEN
jgi:hypothetical protein